MSNNMAKNRIPWIDVAKGYGTLLVILAHIEEGPLGVWIYTFHMPLFFFLSGYVFKANGTFFEFVKKKCRAIVLPYVCLGVPMIFFDTFMHYRYGYYTEHTLVENFWKFIFQRRQWTLWFIACLFCLNIIFYLLVKLCKKEVWLGVLAVLMPIVGLLYYRAGGESLIWNFDVTFMAIPFFYAGYWARPRMDAWDRKLDTNWKYWGTFAVLLVVNIICGYLSLDETGTGLEMFYSQYGNPVFTYVSAFAGVACVILFSKKFAWKPMRYLGENTMLYYAWHQTIMMPSVEAVLILSGVAAMVGLGTAVYKVIWFVGIVVVTTILVWVIKKLGWNWLLGK